MESTKTENATVIAAIVMAPNTTLNFKEKLQWKKSEAPT
jgi:hypothetical protein